MNLKRRIGRFAFLFIFKSPQPLFTKEGLFYDVAFSGFIRNIFERVKSGEHLFAIKLPLFRKEGVGGDLTTATYLKLVSPTPLYKRGAFL